MGKRKRRRGWAKGNLEPGVLQGSPKHEAPKDRQDTLRDGTWERRSNGTWVRHLPASSSFGYAKH
jgi:hypothetical protein